MAKRPRKDEPAPPPDLSHIVEDLRPLAVPIADLVPDPANAMAHGEKNLAAIRGSLRHFRQRKNIVVRRQGHIVEAGNGTLQAAIALGWTHVAAVFVDDDAVTAAAYGIADNRTAELAEWDPEALGRVAHAAMANDDDLQQMLDDLLQEHDLLPPEPSDADPAADGRGSSPPAMQWHLIIECDNETEQTELLTELNQRGLECRALIS